MVSLKYFDINLDILLLNIIAKTNIYLFYQKVKMCLVIKGYVFGKY